MILLHKLFMILVHFFLSNVQRQQKHVYLLAIHMPWECPTCTLDSSSVLSTTDRHKTCEKHVCGRKRNKKCITYEKTCLMKISLTFTDDVWPSIKSRCYFVSYRNVIRLVRKRMYVHILAGKYSYYIGWSVRFYTYCTLVKIWIRFLQSEHFN